MRVLRPPSHRKSEACATGLSGIFRCHTGDTRPDRDSAHKGTPTHLEKSESSLMLHNMGQVAFGETKRMIQTDGARLKARDFKK
jgi:hypothetical protein